MGMLLGMVLFLNMIGALVFLPSAVLIFNPKALVNGPEPLMTERPSLGV
jgi:hypothetical protein